MYSKSNFAAPIFLSGSLLVPLLFAAAGAQADAFIPDASLRKQTGLDCWAYGPATMLEARFERRAGASVAIDVEYDSYYRVIEDRLMNAFRRRTASAQLFDIAAYSADYFHILAVWGEDTYAVNPAPKPWTLLFPTTSGFLINTETWDTQVSPQFATLLDLQKELVALPAGALTDAQAEEKIRVAMDGQFHLAHPTPATVTWPTGGSPQTIVRSGVFDRLLGPDLPGGYAPDAFLMISSSLITGKPELDGQWIRYDDDRYWALGMRDPRELMRLARLSLDRGWPLTLETAGHVMTGLGYQTVTDADGKPMFAYAVVDGDGTVFQPPGLSWQTEETLIHTVADITVFAPALKDALPPRPAD